MGRPITPLTHSRAFHHGVAASAKEVAAAKAAKLAADTAAAAAANQSGNALFHSVVHPSGASGGGN